MIEIEYELIFEINEIIHKIKFNSKKLSTL